jgi:hypothetical protein
VRQLDVEPVEILVLERDEASLLDLEAPDDLVGIDRLSVVPPDLLVRDRREVLLVEEMNLSSLDWVAGNIRTGTLTRPNEMTPLQIGRMGLGLPAEARVSTPATPAKG